MTKYLLLGLSLALASCAAQKALPQYTEAEKAAQRGGIGYWQPDSASRADTAPHTPNWALAVPPVKVDSLSGKLVTNDKPVDKPGLFRRLFPAKAQPLTQHATTPNILRKCKGCTFNVVAGNQTNSTIGKKATSAAGDGATATTIGKAKGPTAVGDSATAIDNTKAGQRGGAAATAPGATATATTVKPGLPWGRIAAGVIGGGFLVWVLFGGGGAVLLAFARRKSSTTNQA